MKLLEGEDLRRHVLESYTKDPKGWSFVISPSPEHGFYDAVVSGPGVAWMLKMDSLFKPFPVVLGTPTEADPRPKPTSPFPYGYRKLSRELVLQILGGEGPPPKDRTIPSLLSVLGSETVVPAEGRCYVQGPFVFADRGKGGLSEGKKELDDKLTSEMRRLLRARYPAYG